MEALQVDRRTSLAVSLVVCGALGLESHCNQADQGFADRRLLDLLLRDAASLDAQKLCDQCGMGEGAVTHARVTATDRAPRSKPSSIASHELR